MAEGAVELRIRDVAIFVDGSEVDGCGVHNLKTLKMSNPSKDWTKRTVAVSIT